MNFFPETIGTQLQLHLVGELEQSLDIITDKNCPPAESQNWPLGDKMLPISSRAAELSNAAF